LEAGGPSRRLASVMHSLSGVFCALWTPTNRDGAILWPALERNLEFITGAGIHGFMALGSTAEFPHLSVGQRKEILERIVRTQLPVIANVSDVSHRVAIDLARHARDAGAVAIAMLPPWFFPASQADLAEFFISVAKGSGMPLVLYNFPEVSGKKIEADTIKRVADEVRVLAVKQSGGDFQYHHDLLRLAQQNAFAVLTGADTRLGKCLMMGCAGAVSGLANAIPEVLVRLYNLVQKKETAPRESALLMELAERMTRIEFPYNVKAAIAARGYETGEPKNPPSAGTLERYGALREDLTRLFASHAKLFRQDEQDL
jgi:dihydrodipicolinate synthase/N-acetylneuraminate lyase